MKTEERVVNLENKRYPPAPNAGKNKRAVSTVLLFVFAFIYLPSLYYWVFRRDIRTAVMQIGSIEESIRANGMLARNEEIIYSEANGKCIYLAEEGERVPAGYKAASVLNTYTGQLVEELKRLNEEILALKLTAVIGNKLYSGSILKIDDEIISEIKSMAAEAGKGSLGTAAQAVARIDGLILKKTELALTESDTGIYGMREKETLRDSLQREIDKSSGAIYIIKPGIISYITDGCEKILSPGSVQTFSPEALDAAWDLCSPASIAGQEVSAGKPFARLITEYYYYILFALDAEKADYYEKGSSIEMKIMETGIVADGQVTYISALSEDGRKLLAVKTYEGLDASAALRKTAVDIIRSHYTGIKIPLKSLMDIDSRNGTAKIVMVEANYSKTREVVISGMNDEYAVIDNPPGTPAGKGISLYATYVVNPWNIQEGQLVIK